MTDPKEINEEVSEEISMADLESINGGFILDGKGIDSTLLGKGKGKCDFSTKSHGSGSGMTMQDWEKENRCK